MSFSMRAPIPIRNGKAYNYTRLWRGEISGKLFGTQERRDTCLAACTGLADLADLSEADRSKLVATINSCFSDDVVWWNALLPGGVQGWASARHLR